MLCAAPQSVITLTHFTAFRRTTTMKRARDQSSTIVDTGNHHAVVAPARAAASPAVVPGGGAPVSETTTSKPTLLSPPPPIQPFSDDSDDARPAGDASSSSSLSSSADGSAVEEGRRKRAKRESQQELEGWRAAANAILSAGVKEDVGGGRSSRGESSGSSRKSFAVVCSSNVNRSIMAEILLKEHDMRAQSYGTGRYVSCVVFVISPSPAPTKPPPDIVTRNVIFRTICVT